MIRADMIPDKVVEAAARELYDALCSDIDPLDWTEIGDWRQDEFRRQARASIAAALNAWPGAVWRESGVGREIVSRRLILPLPQKEKGGQ